MSSSRTRLGTSESLPQPSSDERKRKGRSAFGDLTNGRYPIMTRKRAKETGITVAPALPQPSTPALSASQGSSVPPVSLEPEPHTPVLTLPLPSFPVQPALRYYPANFCASSSSSHTSSRPQHSEQVLTIEDISNPNNNVRKRLFESPSKRLPSPSPAHQAVSRCLAGQVEVPASTDPLVCLTIHDQLHLFSYLCAPKDLFTAAAVCKSWRHFLSSRPMRRQTYMYGNNFMCLNERRTFGSFEFNYMETVQEGTITPHMRRILVDWMVEVADEYGISQTALFLSVNTLDRYLSMCKVARAQLQLVGVSCLLLAAKYEEIYPPEIAELVFIADNSFTRNSVVKMEMQILKVLKFGMTVSTPFSFMGKFVAPVLHALAGRAPLELPFLCSYLLELMLLEHTAVATYAPSPVAASALCMALHILHMPACTQTLELYTSCSILDPEMRDCVAKLYTVLSAAHCQLRSKKETNGAAAGYGVLEKYCAASRQNVARLPLPTSLPGIPTTALLHSSLAPLPSATFIFDARLDG
eukprot:TRINITY_DN11106_c0_g1_i5.p1 TRINITY_DN11106_c0_g1~~TRINITY_DN11106_c0_g1_i5.p1  ORF type:complete len:526 (-),score=141.75 TRINITY_DN11106_c0_g1_i5:123-1700(-)